MSHICATFLVLCQIHLTDLQDYQTKFINIDKTSGKIIWSTNVLKILKERKRNAYVTGFILGSGKIYATTSNGFLIISSATNGKSETFKKIGDPIIADPIISDGSLYVLTKNSKLFGFN